MMAIKKHNGKKTKQKSFCFSQTICALFFYPNGAKKAKGEYFPLFFSWVFFALFFYLDAVK